MIIIFSSSSFEYQILDEMKVEDSDSESDSDNEREKKQRLG